MSDLLVEISHYEVEINGGHKLFSYEVISLSKPLTLYQQMVSIFSVTWSAGDVKEPTHLSKRVGGVVPGVVVYLLFHCTFHAWAGWVSEIKYGLIAAARGAFTS